VLELGQPEFGVLTLAPQQQLAGTAQDCIRMFAPAEVQSGSSVSHFHHDAFPNLLMEPSISRSVFDDVDLTLDLFRDLGWSTPIGDPSVLPSNECVVGPFPG
jgi:hypothetical protein